MRKDILLKKESMSGSEYFSRANLELREWDILSCVCSLLNEYGESDLKYAKQNLHPDFRVYDGSKVELSPVEITEVLPPEYKRNKFWRQCDSEKAPSYYSVGNPIENPWEGLRAAIEKKSRKPYASASWLLVYFDIGRLSFRDWDTPFDELLLAEHGSKPFLGVGVFRRVLVLSADMESLVELFPKPKALVPDTNT